MFGPTFHWIVCAEITTGARREARPNSTATPLRVGSAGSSMVLSQAEGGRREPASWMLWSLSITLLKWRLPLLDHLEGSVVLHAGDDEHLGVSAVLDKGELGYKICSSPVQAQSRTHFLYSDSGNPPMD